MKKKVIFGPPGTGKTYTLNSILKEEIENGVDASKIAYVSYTRKGTYEGRDRAVKAKLMRKDQAKYFKTLHSIAYRWAGVSMDDMVEGDNEILKRFGRLIGMDFKGYYGEEFNSNEDDNYLFWNILNRNNPEGSKLYREGLNTDMLKWVGSEYRRMREANGLSDFTSIIEDYVRRGETLPVEVAIIDEAQDLSTLQWDMVEKAFKNCDRIYYAGDDDQAIYEWSGADLSRFLGIKGERQILHHSYRLPKNIKDYAQNILDCIPKHNRVKKDFNDNGEEGTVQKIMDVFELPLDNGDEWLILSRNKWYLKEVEKQLRDKGLVYTSNGKCSINKRVLSCINAHQRVRSGKGDREDATMGSYYTSGQTHFVKPWFEEMDKLYEGVKTYYRRVIGEGNFKAEPTIHLSTIHRIKGGECDNVVLLTDYSNRIAQSFSTYHDAELRVYYVAATRAKKQLFLVAPNSKNHYTIF